MDVAERTIQIVNEQDVVLARALAEIERERSYLADSCSSAAHWAVLKGLDRRRAEELLRAGRLMHMVPEAEAQVLAGTLNPQTVAVAGGIVPKTPVVPPPTDVDPAALRAVEAANEERARAFFELAKTTSKNKLSREVSAEKERIRQGEAVRTLRFHVRESVVIDWQLARKLARGNARRPLSEGQAFAFVVRDFVKRHDRDDLAGRRVARARRAGPTSETPNSRTVPAAVRRVVMGRALGHCEFPGCTNGTHLELCHIRPHADGGDREPANLVVLCHVHHVMLDLGSLRVFDRTADGVAFVDTATGEIFSPDPRRNAAEVLPRTPAGRDLAAGGAGPRSRVPQRASHRDRLRAAGSEPATGERSATTPAPAPGAAAREWSNHASETAPAWRRRSSPVRARRWRPNPSRASALSGAMPRWRRAAIGRRSRHHAHFH